MLDCHGGYHVDRRWGYGTEQRLTDDNQDCHGVFSFKNLTLALVCDGMGSHQGGTYASNLAVRTIYDTIRDAENGGNLQMPGTLVDAIRRANAAIYEASRRSHKLAGMGSTVAAVATDGTTAWIAHVGDSRVYHVRANAARQLTRDHTMVNLFVEAELLSPEDAASHPEAHVLSRALGLERQIEVDVQEPIAVDYADTFVICSDGVHGVLTEWEFGRIDWTDPQAGVWEVLREVAAREGHDNATVIGMIVGEFDGVGRPATPPPILEPVDDLSSASADLHFQIQLSPAGPVPEPMTASDAALASREPMTQSGAIVAVPDDVDAVREPRKDKKDVKKEVRKFEPPEPATKATATAADVPAPLDAPAATGDKRPAVKKKKKSSGNRGMLVAAAILAATLVIAVLGAVAVVRQFANRATEQPLAVVAAPGTPPVEAVAEAPAAPPVAPPPATVVGSAFFHPVLPEVGPKVPFGPRGFMSDPGGPYARRAAQAAKDRDCGGALDAVRNAITSDSDDHASLYGVTWSCFDAIDQAPLAKADVPDSAAFQAFIPYFEGLDPVPPEFEKQAWRRPAPGGIDLRLEAYADVSVQPGLAEVMLARIGPDAIAEVLGRDLLLEATAGAAFAGLADPTPAEIDQWARRVYITQRALTGPVGSIVQQKRPVYTAPIKEALRAAVRNVDPALLGDPKAEVPLPKAVHLAWLAAIGLDVAAAPVPKPLKSAGGGSRPKPAPVVEKPPKEQIIIYSASSGSSPR